MDDTYLDRTEADLALAKEMARKAVNDLCLMLRIDDFKAVDMLHEGLDAVDMDVDNEVINRVLTPLSDREKRIAAATHLSVVK